MNIQSLGSQASGYTPSINAPQNNTAFKGVADNTQLDTFTGQSTKQEKPFLARLLTNLTIAGVATLAICFGLNKFDLSKNLKVLSKKLGESPINEIKKHLGEYSLTMKRQITRELIKDENLKTTPLNKIKDLITQTSKNENLHKETVTDKIINKLNGFLSHKTKMD